MNKNQTKNFCYSNQQILKDEQSFAKAYDIRYKMSNTKNKDFVNSPIFDINEIKQYYDFELLCEALYNLGYLGEIIKIQNHQFLLAYKNDEEREIRIGKVFTVKQFFF